MMPPEGLRAIARDAGDALFEGLWISSRTARLKTYRDMLRVLGGRLDTDACLARAEIEAGVLAELDVGEALASEIRKELPNGR